MHACTCEVEKRSEAFQSALPDDWTAFEEEEPKLSHHSRGRVCRVLYTLYSSKSEMWAGVLMQDHSALTLHLPSDA